jgi:SurA-like protein
MRFAFKIAFVTLLTVAAGRVFAGEVIDRLVASINNVPILQSDWDQEIRLEAIEQGRTIASFNPEERRASLDRLVDQQLLRLQMGDENVAAADPREVAQQIEKIREAFPEAKTDDGWQQVLARYGIDEAWLNKKVARQIQVMHFVDLRLRPEARVAREDVETYYTDTLVPAVQSKGAKPQSIAQVYPQIEEILRQQKMDALLTSWVHDLRAQTDIQWIVPKGSGPAEDSATATATGGH